MSRPVKFSKGMFIRLSDDQHQQMDARLADYRVPKNELIRFLIDAGLKATTDHWEQRQRFWKEADTEEAPVQ